MSRPPRFDMDQLISIAVLFAKDSARKRVYAMCRRAEPSTEEHGLTAEYWDTVAARDEAIVRAALPEAADGMLSDAMATLIDNCQFEAGTENCEHAYAASKRALRVAAGSRS